MREIEPIFSLRPGESVLLGVGALFGTFAVLLNPVAVGLPIAGTLGAMTMLWSIDTVQDHISSPVSIEAPRDASDSEQTYSHENTLQSEQVGPCPSDQDGPTACSAD